MIVSDSRFDAATDVYIENCDSGDFAKTVGLRQEILLSTTMQDDLDGAFTVAVEDEAAARNLVS